MRRLASALRGRGIVGRPGVEDGGVVVPPPYSPAWDGKIVRNAAAICALAVELAGRAGSAIVVGRFPLVPGEDCCILFGNMLALRRADTGVSSP